MINEKEVYSTIYDITQRNLKNSGQNMIFTKETFLYSTKRNLKCVNAFDLIDFDKATFIQSLYIGFFFRTPEASARNSWAVLEDITVKEFQKRAFDSLSTSQEYMKNGTIICNNIFSESTVKLGNLSTQTVNYNSYVEKLYGIYCKFPKSLKFIIKKILKK